MNPNKNNLSPGFVSVDDAVKLINSDTRENPVVDMDYLVAHIVWIDANHNFRIPKIRRLKPEEVHKTKRGKIVEYENIGDVYVAINTNYEKEFLKKMAKKLDSSVAVQCSECGYCVDACPEMIPIPEYFSLYNLSKNRPQENIYKLYFDKLADEKVPADECTYCGTCLDHCTQKIDIPEELEKVCEHFEEGFSPYG